ISYSIISATPLSTSTSFCLNVLAPTMTAPLSLHDALPIFSNILDSANALISHNRHRLGKNLRTDQGPGEPVRVYEAPSDFAEARSEEHTSELQSRENIVCRLLLEKKKTKTLDTRRQTLR